MKQYSYREIIPVQPSWEGNRTSLRTSVLTPKSSALPQEDTGTVKNIELRACAYFTSLSASGGVSEIHFHQDAAQHPDTECMNPRLPRTYCETTGGNFW